MNNIKTVKGDAVEALVKGDINFLLHQCNAQGVMNSGIAKQIKNTLPEAYGAYLKQYQDNFGDTFGMVSIGGNVINMVSQDNYGYDGKRYTNYGVMADIMSQISEIIYADYGLHTRNLVLGLPYKMGCDRGGGDWMIVHELIEHCLSQYWREVVIYEL